MSTSLTCYSYMRRLASQTPDPIDKATVFVSSITKNQDIMTNIV